MKRIYLVLICLVMLFSAFAMSGCDDGQNENGKNNTEVLNNFEDYKTGFEPLVLANSFGKVEQNSVAKYVKSGEYSAKLTPSGDITDMNAQRPTLKQPLEILRSGVNHTSLKKINLITTEIYNDSQESVSMGIQLQFQKGLSDYMEYTLNSGWNTATYTVNAEALNFSHDITACQSILYIFDKPQKGDAVPTLYMDDITVHLRQDEFKEIDFDLYEGEILSFDKMYQQYVVAPETRLPIFTPSLGLNSNPQYAKKGMSLRVDMRASDGTLPVESYTGFDIIANYIAQTGVEKYTNDYELSFWVYNPNSHKQRLFFELYNQAGNKFFFKDTQLYIEPLQWKKFTYSFEKLNQGQLASDGTKKMGKIYISWKITDLPKDSTLYFDSFEVTKSVNAQ